MVLDTDPGWNVLLTSHLRVAGAARGLESRPKSFIIQVSMR